ncbi:MAG: MBL fold metallo-hydrolase [Erysipelotrichaceae bacterium]|nr:MBL fold metallo-hydrolase [Erysipelotrichaceae bacterium]
MEITKIICGPMPTNMYLLEEDGKVVIIDAEARIEKIRPLLEGKELLAILLTHGHFDHIKGVDELVKEYDVPVYLHPGDKELATSKAVFQENLHLFGFSAIIKSPIRELSEGELKIGPFCFDVLYTPGHTEGSVCFRIGNDLFSGDTLFRRSIGRTDLEGGDMRKMKDSLRRIRELDPQLVVHPGHEGDTVLGEEFQYNFYLQ